MSNFSGDKFPFELSKEGCDLVIKNGAAGTFKINEKTVAVDLCLENLAVLCNGSDKKEYVTILDLCKKSTGFPPSITSLYPNNFGYDTKDDLIAAINAVLGIDIRLHCCLQEGNKLAIDNDKIFCP